MKKIQITKMLLFILPLLVVAIAVSPSSVLVYDGQTTEYYSWMQPVSGTATGWCAPVAALLNYVLFALAVAYGLLKKQWCVKAIRNVAAAACCIAVLPNLVRTGILVIPNVFGGILLLVDAVVAHLLMKNPVEDKTVGKKGKRLERR
jgi:hypothetical protein